MTIRIKKHSPSGTIVLDAPERRNALTRNDLGELTQALSDFHLERSVRAVILTGAGSAFCSGFDLREIQSARLAPNALEIWHQDVSAVRNLLLAMLRFPKPIIAAVNGPAAGIGLALLLASDLVIGSPQTSAHFAESRRGLVAGLVAPLLVFRLGAGKAAHWLLQGANVPSDACLAAGLIHEQVPQDALWARAHELAVACSESAPESLQLTKQLLNETVGEQLGTALAAGAAASAAARTTESAEEGVDAFLEKRAPQWP
ncbi:MAG: enoyl-CoA hydratase/isomerase family protein [Planctomycetales bacterium]|nr:enoyl-CoA hydratase/isomerase family protein [Planctomycetales bacterium]